TKPGRAPPPRSHPPAASRKQRRAGTDSDAPLTRSTNGPANETTQQRTRKGRRTRFTTVYNGERSRSHRDAYTNRRTASHPTATPAQLRSSGWSRKDRRERPAEQNATG